MKKLIIAFVTLCFFSQCSKDESSNPDGPSEVPRVTEITVDDITNNGNGSDLEATFSKAEDETLVSEYRIMVVPSNRAFSLEEANAVASSAYTSVVPNGSNHTVVLDASSVDVEQQPIVEAKEYVVSVLSISTDESISNSISPRSEPITLAQTTIKITYIGNDGVYISDGEKAVIIDALPGNLNGWNPVANGIQSKVESGASPFGNVVAAMVTHNHGDHYSISSVNSFLSVNSDAVFLAPSQVVESGINGGADQIEDLNLALDTETEVNVSGVRIRIMRIRHFTPQDGTNFSGTVNYAFLVEIGGKKVLHIGDGNLSIGNFSDLGLKSEGVDVALIPTFNFSSQLTEARRQVLLDHISPDHIIGLHLASATPSSDVTNLYPGAIVFRESLQSIRF